MTGLQRIRFLFSRAATVSLESIMRLCAIVNRSEVRMFMLERSASHLVVTPRCWMVATMKGAI